MLGDPIAGGSNLEANCVYLYLQLLEYIKQDTFLIYMPVLPFYTDDQS